ncbi:polysaccharide deacetylase family protein [Aquabacterium lacunae]|uniref:Polysaccharide deacetylase family protein n=1 Tax=Aquabacterium lacunae TaxID=2528630 RepID=A0A4Q9GZG5_9BURK|nr:polysaccharide deacetylase family protein [Aquabacterium lacunae]TBO30235.1 polysaccharide deacetylase family protein [Aquabacterium lacunae]
MNKLPSPPQSCQTGSLNWLKEHAQLMLFKGLLISMRQQKIANRLSILTFHKLPAAPDPLLPRELLASDFVQMLAQLKVTRKVLPLEDALQRLRQGRLPEGAVVLTFDDGYGDWHQHITPSLLRHDLHATFFITTGILDGQALWHERLIECIRRMPADGLTAPCPWTGAAHTHTATREEHLHLALKHAKTLTLRQREEMLSALEHELGGTTPGDFREADVRQLSNQGFGIGAHTQQHPILLHCSPHEAREEIARSKHTLEHITRAPVPFFAYPNGKPGGDFDSTHVEMVKHCGFKAAFTTSAGTVDRSSDWFQLPRLGPWKASATGFELQLIRNLFHVERRV